MEQLATIERRHSLVRMSGALERQRDEALRAGAAKLAQLIAGAIAEASILLAAMD